MRNPESGTTIVFNGELYNVASIRAELEHAGHSFDGHSDTEVVLHAYDAWGPRFLERMRGMFAIAIWDERAERLFLARDRLGIKPLYFAIIQEGIVFASELRTMLASGLVQRRVCGAGLESFLAFGAIQEPQTTIDGVEMLPAGYFGWFQRGEFKIAEYWSLEAKFRERALVDRAQAVTTLREKLGETVDQHLLSDRPLGVFLSGGIDSSALVGLASEARGVPPRTVSVIFPQQAYSEQPFIDEVRRRYGTKHTAIDLTDDEVLKLVPAALAAMDQPSVDGVNTYIVSRVAHDVGLTVALSGVGGDELFGGYDTFAIVPKLEALRSHLPRGVARLGARAIETMRPRSDRQEKLSSWLRSDKAASAYGLRRQLFAPHVVAALLGGTSSGADSRLPPRLDDAPNTVSLYELSMYMRNTLLRDSDVMSMANGLEIRVPFLDHELVELVARMPGAWKRGKVKPKPMLVDAASHLLPRSVVTRRKMGFTLPYESWLRGPLKELVGDNLLDSARGGAIGALMDHAHVREVWERFHKGETGWTRPWALYVARAWGETNLAGNPAPIGSGIRE